jgi:DNA-directed RNA polymerase subunit RPC12/RpoP
MPRWICAACSKEFWGWAVYYRYKAGTRLVCPECEGSLVEWSDRAAAKALEKEIGGEANP